MALKLETNHIKPTSKKDQFTVKSRRDPDSEYQVDTALGTCTCEAGSDGSPCCHQLATTLHYRSASLNCIPTLHPSSQRQLAYIALGKKANNDTTFYAAVSQHQDEIEQATERLEDVVVSCWSLKEEFNEEEDGANESLPESENNLDPMKLSQELDLVFDDLKMRLQDQDPQLRSGVRKFINRYNKMKKSPSNALMASSFHTFGSLHGGTVTNIQGGGVRRGRHIPVQATASGRRKHGTKGKGPVPSGRPAKLATNKENLMSTRYQLPIRRQTKGKRLHNISFNV